MEVPRILAHFVHSVAKCAPQLGEPCCFENFTKHLCFCKSKSFLSGIAMYIKFINSKNIHGIFGIFANWNTWNICYFLIFYNKSVSFRNFTFCFKKNTESPGLTDGSALWWRLGFKGHVTSTCQFSASKLPLLMAEIMETLIQSYVSHSIFVYFNRDSIDTAVVQEFRYQQ